MRAVAKVCKDLKILLFLDNWALCIRAFYITP